MLFVQSSLTICFQRDLQTKCMSADELRRQSNPGNLMGSEEKIFTGSRGSATSARNAQPTTLAGNLQSMIVARNPQSTTLAGNAQPKTKFQALLEGYDTEDEEPTNLKSGDSGYSSKPEMIFAIPKSKWFLMFLGAAIAGYVATLLGWNMVDLQLIDCIGL